MGLCVIIDFKFVHILMEDPFFNPINLIICIYTLLDFRAIYDKITWSEIGLSQAGQKTNSQTRRDQVGLKFGLTYILTPSPA